MTINADYLLQICYLISSITFVVGLKMMSSPKTARNGNLVAATGMVLALAATLIVYNDLHGRTSREPVKILIIAAGIALGAAIGWVTARRVKMTAMPQLVSLFNCMGGGCAALICFLEFHHTIGHYTAAATIIAGMTIGGTSFAGSVVAFLKLNGTLEKPLHFPGFKIVNAFVLFSALSLGVLAVFGGGAAALNASIALTIVFGVMFVLPIGGADMPVVISLLNSFTGLAAAFGGFLYHNQAMITGGILVGSAGTLLTIIMCKAMNRSLASVIFGALGKTAGTVQGAAAGATGSIRDITVTDAAVLINYAKKVCIVPGYGLAVAQAQYVIHELETLLETRGVAVTYAIHPVAGRMPGHMNVLLAESNVSYDLLVELDDANSGFATTDVVLVVGANDVVNPAAKNNRSSPIYGMPILEVEAAAHIVIIKRSMRAGYAGIDNGLFYNPKASMLFGDAKKVLTELIREIKNL
jgi:H+-translocating NAD(P) transhydrogenase subunit beta